MTIEIDNNYEALLLPDYKRIITRVIEAALDYEKCPYEAQVYVLLTDNEEIHVINQSQRGIDRPTDVLSFPMTQYPLPADFDGLEENEPDAFHPETGELILGDIIISMDRVVSQAEEYGHSQERELAFLTAHSMLHLMGYDHMTSEEGQVMEKKQEEILARCGYTRLYDTVIIGAGPAGMTAAIYASEDNHRVLLLDRLDKVGKKLLVTGNGKCNLTNLDQRPDCYRSDSPKKAWDIFSGYDDREVIAFMDRLGICTKDRNGYVYPHNEQAASVREAFEEYLEALPGVTVLTEQTVTGVTFDEEKKVFRAAVRIEGEKELSYEGATLIIATGGLAGVRLGCEGDGYRFARGFGHRIIPPMPALTSLCSKAPFLKRLSGVRCPARVSLMVDGSLCCSETGELQWTDYGISGVAVFCLSRYAIRALSEKKNISINIDLIPDLSSEDLTGLLRRFKDSCGYKNSQSFLNGIIAKKLSPVILKEAGINEDKPVRDFEENDFKKLVSVLKAFPLRIQGYKSYEKAQTTMGGLPLDEVTSELESLKRKGLFFAGEVLDVDGNCGGYNLQWAFSSGKTAGTRAWKLAFDRGMSL